MPKVFVYGTLRKGDCRNRMLVEATCVAAEAYLDGFDLLDMGSFPGIVPTESASVTRVRGEVYDVSDDLLADLDVVEGFQEDRPDDSLYLRQEVTVKIFGSEDIEVLTYIYNERRYRRHDRHNIIESGDWFDTKAQPPPPNF